MFTRIGTKIKSMPYVSTHEYISDVAVIDGDTVTYKKVNRFIDPRLTPKSMSVHARLENGTFNNTAQNSIPLSIDAVYRTLNRASAVLDSAHERLSLIEKYNSMVSDVKETKVVTSNNDPE